MWGPLESFRAFWYRDVVHLGFLSVLNIIFGGFKSSLALRRGILLTRAANLLVSEMFLYHEGRSGNSKERPLKTTGAHFVAHSSPADIYFPSGWGGKSLLSDPGMGTGVITCRSTCF